MVQHRGSTPPLFGFIPRSVWRWFVRGLWATGGLCAFAVIVMRLQLMGTEQTDRRTTPAVDQAETEFGELRSEKKERRSNMRLGLLEINQFADDIWADIDEFEMEAKAWKQRFEDLLLSSTGSLLGEKDPWAVRYFFDKWGRRLPKPSAAADYRANLSTLVEPIRDALEQEHRAYRPTQESLDNIWKIATQAELAKECYHQHRVLLDALVRLYIKENVDQKTLKWRVEELEGKMTLIKFGHSSSLKELEMASMPSMASENAETDAAQPTEVEDLDELYEQVGGQSGDGSQYGRTTLIRDTVVEARDAGSRYAPR
jgi:hypothetical protein